MPGERTEHARQPDGAQDSSISSIISGTGSLRETTRHQGQATRHVPSVRSSLALLKISEHEWDRLENAKTLMHIMKALNLDYCPSEEALTSAPGRDLILFVVYLVDSLPGFIPKTTVEFDGRRPSNSTVVFGTGPVRRTGFFLT